MTMTPEKLSANELLANHGPSGWLIRRLQRYAILGWIMFIGLFILFFLIVILSSFAPRPIVAVDQSGKVLGSIEYLKPESRSDDDLMAAGKRFTALFLSLNSETIFDDYAEAMNLMGGSLKTETDNFIKKSSEDKEAGNYLGRVAAAKSHSWIEFDPQDGVKIINRNGMKATLRLVGNIMVSLGDGAPTSSHKFDITFGVETVARNSFNTSGFIFVSRKDN
jgi:hypothetical protein